MSIVAVVKMTKKGLLDELSARLTLDLKKKIPQQELLDLCVTFASENYDAIVNLLQDEDSGLTKEKIKAIRALAADFDENTRGSIDADVYS